MQSFTICSVAQKVYAKFGPPQHSNP